jgi:hypothetical protein
MMERSTDRPGNGWPMAVPHRTVHAIGADGEVRPYGRGLLLGAHVQRHAVGILA